MAYGDAKYKARIEEAYRRASQKHCGFFALDPEMQDYLVWEFYQDLCNDEQADYWASEVKAMERAAKEAQFTDATDPHALWEWQAGEVD